MISNNSLPEALTADLKRLILWLLEQQPSPLSLFRTADPGWWTELRRHRLSPLLYTRLLSAGLVEGVPKAVTQLLRHDYLGALQLFLGQERESRRLLTKLGDAGIEAILLKGADLRLRLYEDPATRPMTDLDLLVSPASLGAVCGFLGNLGYTLSRDSVNPRPGFRERYRVGLHFQAPPPASLRVDLHWGLEAVAGYYRLPYARLAPQAQTLDWEAMPVRVLSPEHTLMHLCLHFYDEGDIALQSTGSGPGPQPPAHQLATLAYGGGPMPLPGSPLRHAPGTGGASPGIRAASDPRRIGDLRSLGRGAPGPPAQPSPR